MTTHAHSEGHHDHEHTDGSGTTTAILEGSGVQWVTRTTPPRAPRSPTLGTTGPRRPAPSRTPGGASGGSPPDRCYQVYNEAIVVPETIDAIRALTGTVTDGAASIAMIDDVLGMRREFLPTRCR